MNSIAFVTTLCCRSAARLMLRLVVILAVAASFLTPSLAQSDADLAKVRDLMERAEVLQEENDFSGAKVLYLEVEEYLLGKGLDHEISDSFYANFAVVSYNARDNALARRLAETYIARTGRSGQYRDRIDRVLVGVERAEQEKYRKDERLLAESRETLRMYPDGEYAEMILSNVGQHYLFGWGTPKDCGRAALWFNRAAEKGSALGAARLGDMYRIGLGLPRDDRKAIQWYERAIQLDNRHHSALNNLGVMHHLGRGTPRNAAKARTLFSDARAAGVPRSNLALPEGATPRWYSQATENHTC